MRLQDGLRIMKSTIAGMGLFATRSFRKGEHITDYTGDELVLSHDRVGGPYALALTQRKAIDAARTNTAYGRWANDPHGSDMSANAEFVINRASELINNV